MQLDTAVTRRLRDALLSAAEDSASGALEDPDALTPEQHAALDRILPIIETLYLMMVADSDAAATEREAVTGALVALSDGVLGGSLVHWLLERFERALAEQGREERLQQIGGQLSADRDDAEAAFTLAAAVAMADGRVDARENQLVNELGEWLGISPKRAALILAEATEG